MTTTPQAALLSRMHWGGRWWIVIDGPAPKSHDSEDDFDAAIDAAIAASGRQS